MVKVAIDWMSCTQSLRKAVQQHPELCYIPLDKQEWVFSQAMEGWVQNILVDLETTTCDEIIMGEGGSNCEGEDSEPSSRGEGDAAGDVARLQDLHEDRQLQHHQGQQLQAHPDRPPRDDHSEKGLAAHRADSMVKKAVQFYRYLKKLHHGEVVPVYLENPVGSLCRRQVNSYNCSQFHAGYHQIFTTPDTSAAPPPSCIFVRTVDSVDSVD